MLYKRKMIFYKNKVPHSVYRFVRKIREMMKKRYLDFQELPVQQPGMGDFNAWSTCSRTCGRGEQYRTFNITQRAGSGGIKCIYENGDIDIIINRMIY